MGDVRHLVRLSGAISIALATAAAPVSATIVSGTIDTGPAGGTFVKLDPTAGGFAVGNNDFNLPDLFAFDERQNVVLTTALAADVGLTSVAIGTIVSSHYIFFDPLKQATVTGSVTFDAPILAIITTRRGLLASNYLGASQVTYHDPALVGLESADFAVIGALFDTDLKFIAATPGDSIRVITAAAVHSVPEPATWAMMIGGFALVGRALRRSPRQQRVEVAAA